MKQSVNLVLMAILLVGCSRPAGDAKSSSPSLTPTASAVQATTQTTTATSVPSPTASLSTTALAPIAEYDELIHIFDYDASAPLDTTQGYEQVQDGVVTQMLSYKATDRCRVTAILTSPDGEGPYPAIIYMHRGGADKSQFREEAVLLAGQGVTSLLLDSPFNSGCGTTFNPRKGYILMVLFARRSVDLLRSLPQVDPDRIGYVGHSLGATWGGVLAGVEPRIRTFVLMAGYVQVSLHDSPDVRDLDAILYIPHARDSSFLFQFSIQDQYISQEEAQNYFDAAGGEKSILWYDSTHEDLQQDGQYDRLKWLSMELGFPYP